MAAGVRRREGGGWKAAMAGGIVTVEGLGVQGFKGDSTARLSMGAVEAAAEDRESVEAEMPLPQ